MRWGDWTVPNGPIVPAVTIVQDHPIRFHKGSLVFLSLSGIEKHQHAKSGKRLCNCTLWVFTAPRSQRAQRALQLQLRNPV